ncbi:MAG: hypothetical protein J6S92_12310, partial [Oscillospiraceae bacterium]|nr:hypothetical protein [Oscillospiraceae bacterium]
ILLRKWLLTAPDTQLANWKAADFCNDNTLNAADLSLMKQALLTQTAPDYVEPAADRGSAMSTITNPKQSSITDCNVHRIKPAR